MSTKPIHHSTNRLRTGRIFLAGVAIVIGCTAKTQAVELEETVCGIKEPIMFWLWSRSAGRAHPERVLGRPNVVDIAIETKDGRTLRGFQLRATSSISEPAYLLVAQGNAMLADQILLAFQPFADAGYDVFVWDYRGYGRSDGRRRLKAMVNDYREIIAELDSRHYARRAFYGLSFGGILMLDALRGDSKDKSVVIDSSPSRLSDYGCPPQHDPVANLPSNGSQTLVIVGQRDTVVTPSMSHDLVATARAVGATVINDPDFGHPFIDGQTARRFRLVESFLMRLR